MEIWLDTTDLKTIEHAHSLDILYGVTTNPIILAEANQAEAPLFKEILVRQIGHLAVQIAETTKEDMLIQARSLHSFSSRIIIKVPACRDGYFVIEELSEAGISVMATAIFEPHQAFLSLKLGAAYVAPYIGRIEDEGKDPRCLLKLIHQMKATYGLDGKVIAAGIRTMEHVAIALESNCNAITLSKTVYEKFLSAPSGTEKALEQFKRVEHLIKFE